MLEDSHPRSLEGRLRRHPEGGAGCGVLRRWLATAAPGGRDPARQALRPGCEELAERDPDARRSVSGGGCSVTEKRGTGAENRHGGAPRGERPASWDARRLASAWPAASCAGPTGVSQTPERLSALRPPLKGVSEAKRKSPGAKKARRERVRLFDIVKNAASDAR